MDASVDNEANTVNVYDSKRFRTNESRFLTKHGRSSNTQEMVIPDGVNIQESTSTSTRCLDDAGAIVEELTIRNCSSGDMETGLALSAKERIHGSHNTWHAFFPDKTHNSNKQVKVQNDTVNVSRLEEKRPALCDTFVSPSVTRSRMLSQSGFSKYFAKNTLKGKGVISSRDQDHIKAGLVDCNSAPDTSVHEGLSLREWLKSGQNKVDKSKSMCIFKQILDLVDSSHSRGEVLLSLRPSCFKLTPLNQVLYMGSPNTNLENSRDNKKELEPDALVGGSQSLKRRKHGENGNSFCRWPQFAVNSGVKDSGYGFNEENMSSSLHLSAASQMVSNVDSDALEEQWYACPEDSRCSTLASNVYSLGVLLFELLGSFESARAHATAMLNLRQRILPPSYLSENPREAGFCLWLLHPEPSSRPTTREILQSDLISGIQQSSIKQLSSTISQEDTDSDLMLHFLVSLKEQRLKRATKLVEDIKCLESDISEIESRRADNNNNTLTFQENHSVLTRNLKPSTFSSLSESRLINNISHLEHAYFSVRSTIENPDPNSIKEYGEHEVLRSRENNIVTKKTEADKKPLDRLGVFFNGLCKYARYSKFEVRGILRNGDFANSGNVICSLGFDRDEDYFATAGVSRKIKIYDYHALLKDSVDIHYRAVEMSNKSKLSSICWNNYIRNYLASTDYDGAVNIWDAGTGEAISHHIEHERRAWSVDFSRVDPIKFASGSDDCSVKLWSINEKKSLTTIKTVANVCCVQFSPYSTHLLSFGSADYKTYCYDLRNVSTPMCILSDHGRAISYVKFLDYGTLVSASTDNTLKLWDLNKTEFGCLSTNSCILTFKGHTNEKNFVGLSVADGYIACGSETNEVFAYYRSLPMPITSHKFGSIDPISSKETEHENNHFVSSVCWRQKSDTVLAANSSGCLKLLQMV
ncbi:protein SPA1-RELATED 2-like [Bidens hawaiensis]|uniref:protein SPA1-RELATED 2-like n=1 Tax=Bidens hawaiensis TaxID=980011 RepID=UPI00404A13C3